MTVCVCDTGKFCRPCHCRRIAAEREARPGYKAKHACEVRAYWDQRSGIPLQDEERAEMPRLRRAGLSAAAARLVLARSRRATNADGGGK